MKINVTQPIKDYNGETLNPDKDGNPQPLREYLVTALNAVLPNDSQTPEQKIRAYGLSVRLYNSDELILSLDERTLLKQMVGKIYNPLIYGRICDLLDPQNLDDIPEEDKELKKEPKKGS